MSRLKHLSGKHDQASHGYRFGKAPAPSKARQMRREGTWGDYVQRARKRAGGLSKAEQRRTEKVKAARETISKERDTYAKKVAATRREKDTLDKYKADYLEAEKKYSDANKRLSSLIKIEKARKARGEPVGDDLLSEMDRVAGESNKAKDMIDRTLGRMQAQHRIYQDKEMYEAYAKRSYLEKTKEARDIAMREGRREAAIARAELFKNTRALKKKHDQLEKKKDEIMERGEKLIEEKGETHPDVDKVFDEFDAALSNLSDVRIAMTKYSPSTLHHKSKGTMPFVIEGDIQDSDESTLKDGVNDFNNLIGKNPLMEARTPSFGYADGSWGGRPYYVNKDNSVRVSKGKGNIAGRRVVIHELGHALENLDPAIRDERQKFTRRRWKGYREEKLADLFPVANYHPSETVIRDKFLSGFWDKGTAAYAGKRYAGNESSEILSIGLELFHSDPMRFAESDPDFF